MLRMSLIIGMIIFAFIGCRVESNIISLSVKDLQSAIDGKMVNVGFKADASVPMDLQDKSQKAQLESVRKVLEQYIDTEDFDIGEGLIGTKIEIEGTLPLLRANGNDDVAVPGTSPWVLVVIPVDKSKSSVFSKYDYRLSLATTNHFPDMNEKLGEVNFMLTAEKTQPMKIRLKNKGGKKIDLFCGPVEYDGKTFQYLEKTTGDKKITFEMNGGVFQKIQPNFFFTIQK